VAFLVQQISAGRQQAAQLLQKLCCRRWLQQRCAANLPSCQLLLRNAALDIRHQIYVIDLHVGLDTLYTTLHPLNERLHWRGAIVLVTDCRLEYAFSKLMRLALLPEVERLAAAAVALLLQMRRWKLLLLLLLLRCKLLLLLANGPCILCR
jgi:hypothetical protein